MKKKFTRREALAGSFLIAGSAAKGEEQAAKFVTPAQIEGPFYPDMDNDLTRLQGAKKKPDGKFIYVHGTVCDKRTLQDIATAEVPFLSHTHNQSSVVQRRRVSRPWPCGLATTTKRSSKCSSPTWSALVFSWPQRS